MHFLHVFGSLAHLDVTSNNIMLRKEGYKAWDQPRLLDFGFSQFCSNGKHALLAQPTELGVCNALAKYGVVDQTQSALLCSVSAVV